MLNIKLTLPHNNLEDTAKDKTGSSEEDSTHDHKRFDEINRVCNSMFCMICTEAHGLTSVDYVERDQADPGAGHQADSDEQTGQEPAVSAVPDTGCQTFHLF